MGSFAEELGGGGQFYLVLYGNFTGVKCLVGIWVGYGPMARDCQGLIFPVFESLGTHKCPSHKTVGNKCHFEKIKVHNFEASSQGVGYSRISFSFFFTVLLFFTQGIFV